MRNWRRKKRLSEQPVYSRLSAECEQILQALEAGQVAHMRPMPAPPKTESKPIMKN